MNKLVFKSEAALNEVAAGIIAGLLQTKPDAVLGLATGGTPVGIYKELVRLYAEGKVSFRKASAFNLDEYVGLPPDHPESYRSYMQKHLYDHIDMPPENRHIPDGNAPDPEAESRRYDELLERVGRIDLQLLGIGHNGHIGFNEPGPALIGATHVARLSDKTRQANSRYFPSLSDVPEKAITMGVGTILKARRILLVAKGADKAEIIRKALYGPITTEVPASLLQTHPGLTVLLTEDAAG